MVHPCMWRVATVLSSRVPSIAPLRLCCACSNQDLLASRYGNLEAGADIGQPKKVFMLSYTRRIFARGGVIVVPKAL